MGSVVDYNRKRGFVDAGSAFKRPMFPPAMHSMASNQMSYTGQEHSSMVSSSEANLTQVVWGTNIQTAVV